MLQPKIILTFRPPILKLIFQVILKQKGYLDFQDKLKNGPQIIFSIPAQT